MYNNSVVRVVCITTKCHAAVLYHTKSYDVLYRFVILLPTILVVQVEQSLGACVCLCVCVRTLKFELNDL